MYYCLSSAPTGWIECNGAAITVAMGSAYTAIRALLINASNPFGLSGSDPKIPDLRGRFIRSNGSDGTYTSGTFGQTQDDAIVQHGHTLGTGNGNKLSQVNAGVSDGSGTMAFNAAWNFNQSASTRFWPALRVITDTTPATETRPANLALLACIKL
jgi:hypothetical protein